MVRLMKKSSGSVNERFTRAFDENYSVMFNAVRAKVGSFDDAEEICQELFLRLYQRIGEVANPRAWLFGALRLVVLEHYRKKGHAEDDIDRMCEQTPRSFCERSPETGMLLQEALESEGMFSDERERSLFELVAIDGYSYADAARTLRISYRQARYGFECAAKRIVSWLKGRGISNLEEML